MADSTRQINVFGPLVQIGKIHQEMDVTHLPSIGTKFMVDKPFTEDGSSWYLEVTAHEWRILDVSPTESSVPAFEVMVKTRRVD
jgi:hypothetical protein